MDIRLLLDELFFFLVVFYLLGCFSFVKNHFFQFTSHTGAIFSTLPPGVRFTSLAPTCELFCARQVPVCFTPEGVWVLHGDQKTETEITSTDGFVFIPYDQMEKIEASTHYLAIDDIRISASSPVYAERMARRIRDVKKLDREDRRGKIGDYLKESFDVAGVHSFRKTYHHPIRILKTLAIALFVMTYMVLPLIVFTPLVAQVKWSVIVGLTLFYYVLTLIYTMRLNRKIYADVLEYRLSVIISFFLLPIETMHAARHVTKESLTQYDFITIAAALVEGGAFTKMAGREIYRARHLARQCRDPALKDYWSDRSYKIGLLLVDRGIDVKNALAPPEDIDHATACYCPVCGSGYNEYADTCADCGMGLVRL